MGKHNCVDWSSFDKHSLFQFANLLLLKNSKLFKVTKMSLNLRNQILKIHETAEMVDFN